MEVFIEPLEPPPALYVFGAGHVGYYLARVASEAGFEVHVVDDRAAFANRERFPFAASVVVEDIPTWLGAGRASALGLRGDRHARASARPRRAAARWRRASCATSGSSAAAPRLRASTTSCSAKAASTLEQLSHVHAPIGLDIGAVTPQEIAVSIVAELIAIRRGKAREIADASLRWMPKARALPARPEPPWRQLRCSSSSATHPHHERRLRRHRRRCPDRRRAHRLGRRRRSRLRHGR